MRHRSVLLAVLLATLAAAPEVAAQGAAQGARAPMGTIGQIRADGVLRCGSAIRPGLAFPGDNGVWFGLNVDVCRAIAAAVLGDGAKIEVHGYAQRRDFGRIAAAMPADRPPAEGRDDVAFLTATELFGNGLLDAVLPGPPVFQQTVQIMVWDSNPVTHVADLGRTMVCGEPGTGPDNDLHAYAAAQHWPANLSPWMEMEEMMDAFAVGRCPAVVGEATALAALRIGAGLQGHPARLLPEPIATYPVMAVTPADDPQWAIIVAWAVHSILAGDGPQTLDIPGASLGLDRDWQARVRAVGSYAALYRRNLGADSPLGLPLGVNDSWRNGGLSAPPSID